MKLKINNKIVNIILIIISILLLLIFIPIFGWNDLQNIIKWYIMLLLMTITGLSLTTLLFNNLYDKGYIFSKVIGILLSGYLMWLLSSFHLLKFNFLNSLISIIIIIIISVILLIIKKKNIKQIITKDYLQIILRIELMFFILFILSCYIKGFNPDAISTEKFMDYGYMAIMNKSDYMPPQDLWFSGKYINYYYFGQYISTFLTKVARIKVNYGYNLMLITLFCLTLIESFTIIYNLLLFTNKKKNQHPFVGGLIAALATTIAGNFHYVIYNLIIPLINKFNGINDNNYYFASSTRFIGFNPPTEDKTIHEFPSYSFILGDLHAHVINIIFVLLLIGLLVLYYITNKKEKKTNNTLTIIIISTVLGIFKMTNYWDFIIYIVVVILTIIFSNITKIKSKKEFFLLLIKDIFLIISISTIVSIPFINKFQKMISGVKFAPYHTPIYQLLILWGLPVILLIYYIIITIKDIKIKNKKKNIILKYLSNINYIDLFVIVLGICALGLIIIPEIVYVVDIYIGSVRANTMFKLTYQSFILFGLCFGYFITKLIASNKKYNKVIGTIFLLLLSLTFGYSITAVKSWFGEVNNINNYKTLDATKFLEDYYIIYKMPQEQKDKINPNINTSDDLEMINWFNKKAHNSDIILETYGESYTLYNRISVFTGLATPMGWQTHEWLWRAGSSLEMPLEVSNRIVDIENIYTNKDIKILKKLIKKYNITYIVIGYNERIRYAKGDNELTNEQLLKNLGTIVFETNKNNLNNSSYIIKVK